ncbi:quinone oxidoreductase-like protein 1 [Planococcus citri]|uniref:quinone oxidoreductase-like protein 1 n=1 Tax=Planococcus citri TaxID=170843 RepID=UPI0031F93CBD
MNPSSVPVSTKKSKYAYLNKKNDMVFCEQDVSTDLKKFDVLVKVLACGISIANEEYKPVVDDSKMDTEYRTLGTDISGIVQSVGSEVNTLHVGDRVAGVIPVSCAQSGCGQYVVIEQYDLVRVPECINFADAAACIGDCIRAYIALHYCSKITKDDIILVLNGALPCSNICVQIAHHVGAKILTTCMSPTEKTYLETFDDCIDEIIDLSESTDIDDTLFNECMNKTDNLGVDVVLDLETSMKEDKTPNQLSTETIISCLTIHGRWVSCNSRLQLDPPDSQKLFDRCACISFLYEQAWLMSKIAQGKYQHILTDAMHKLKENIIKPYVYHTVNFESLPEVIQQLSKNQVNRIVASITHK